MGLTATAKGGSFKLVSPGNYVARCYSLLDMGTQTSAKFNNSAHKIRLSWEVLDTDSDGQPMTVDRDGETVPMTVSAEYTLSLNEKASLRKTLASWRGRDFNPEELKAFDVSKLLGAYAMVNVTHSDGADGKVYANVSTVTPLPKQLSASKPQGVHELQMFNLDAPDMRVFDSLPKFLQDKIMASPEWQAHQRGGKSGAAEVMEEELESDDVPFITASAAMDMESRFDRRIRRMRGL